MAVTESKMAWGDFSIPLLPDTPRKIIDMLTLGLPGKAFNSLIRIFPDRIGVDEASSTRARDLFAGVFVTRPDPFTIQGPSVTRFLGENSGSTDLHSEEVGPLSGTNVIVHDGTTSGSLTDWTNDILTTTDCVISLGSVPSSAYPSGTRFNGLFIRKTPKTIFDMWLCHRFGVEYRVNPDLTLDIGLSDDLWPWTPPYPFAVKRGGRDLNANGFNAVAVNLEMDYTDWASRCVTYIANPAALGYYDQLNPYKSVKDGGPFNWTRLQNGQESGSATQATATADADMQSQAASTKAIKVRSVSLSTNEYAITQRVTPGDYVYVYDVDEGLFDQTNVVPYQGQNMYPVKLRCEAMSWPLRHGMAVMYDNRATLGTDTVVDLTPYVDFASEASQDTTLTVGAPPPTIGRMMRLRR